MHDKTMTFSVKDERDNEMKEILSTVYQALSEKGYNPINQLVGYILSEDPTYITTYNNVITYQAGSQEKNKQKAYFLTFPPFFIV